jgi:starvation-inducible DNA-binding protein
MVCPVAKKVGPSVRLNQMSPEQWRPAPGYHHPDIQRLCGGLAMAARPSRQKKSRVSASSQVAPAVLSTPTDLKPQERQAVAQAINVLVADAFALHVKTKNFHWHLFGPQFRDLHLLFDEQAESILESVDALAERVRRVGGTTIRSLGHICRLTGIQDDDDATVAPMEMVRRLLEDNRRMALNQRQALEICDRQDDTVTANLLEEVLDQTEKRVWFLFEILQPAK